MNEDSKGVTCWYQCFAKGVGVPGFIAFLRKHRCVPVWMERYQFRQEIKWTVGSGNIPYWLEINNSKCRNALNLRYTLPFLWQLHWYTMYRETHTQALHTKSRGTLLEIQQSSSSIKAYEKLSEWSRRITNFSFCDDEYQKNPSHHSQHRTWLEATGSFMCVHQKVLRVV